MYVVPTPLPTRSQSRYVRDMEPKSRPLVAAISLVIAACSSTHGASPATPIPEAPPSAAAATRDTTRRGYTEADVQFMQGMIGHHAQALAMAELVPNRTTRPDMKLLAERITISQKDEIARMQRWLRSRGEAVPEANPHAHHAAGQHEMMPGMLTNEEMTKLEQSTGAEFDRLFLEGMIKHHEGALTMVHELFASPGGGQEPELFRFASDVDADQRAEIRRMQKMLEER